VGTHSRWHPASNKVPAIDGWFWGVKLLTTAFGEAASDYVVRAFNPYLAVASVGVVFVLALGIQFWMPRYRPVSYWFAAAMVACFGTMVADAAHVQFGISYEVSTITLAALLAVVFIVWYRVERTLSIHAITTTRREMFYWATIVVTFSLGTAAGDLAASLGNMGYLKAALVFLAAILVPALIYLVTRTHAMVWFWTAYVITRPLGASFADWFSKPASSHGLGFGDGRVAVVLGLCIVAALIVLSAIQSRSAAITPSQPHADEVFVKARRGFDDNMPIPAHGR